MWTLELPIKNSKFPTILQPNEKNPIYVALNQLQKAALLPHIKSHFDAGSSQLKAEFCVHFCWQYSAASEISSMCWFCTLIEIAALETGAPFFIIQCDSVFHHQQLNFFLSPSVLSFSSLCQKSIELNEQNWAVP